MNTTSYIEELFLDADRALEEGNLAEGKRLLEDILQEEPSFGKAHNHMGWLFKTKYQDFKSAERHFKLAIKFDPEYQPSYLNYANMLRDLGRLDEFEEMLYKAEKMESANKAAIAEKFGTLYELRLRYKKAIREYRKAIKLSLNDRFIEELKADIRRCNSKRSFLQRFLNVILRRK